ncbi:MAG TPA: DUF4416 family protein [Gemmataceae bacterium]|jgi:hypothetical protein
MSEPRSPAPALLVVAVFSRHEEAFAWAQAKLETLFGSVGLRSEPFVFNQTSYYEASMGRDLRKQFLAFERVVPPDRLADIKRQTNALEHELAVTAAYPEARPVNLDPGLLVLGKFMLATTKDQAHRIYLRDGIFAEVTLHYQASAFEPWPWTYADYRLPCVHDFLQQAREYYRQRLREERAADERP